MPFLRIAATMALTMPGPLNMRVSAEHRHRSLYFMLVGRAACHSNLCIIGAFRAPGVTECASRANRMQVAPELALRGHAQEGAS